MTYRGAGTGPQPRPHTHTHTHARTRLTHSRRLPNDRPVCDHPTPPRHTPGQSDIRAMYEEHLQLKPSLVVFIGACWYRVSEDLPNNPWPGLIPNGQRFDKVRVASR